MAAGAIVYQRAQDFSMTNIEKFDRPTVFEGGCIFRENTKFHQRSSFGAGCIFGAECDFSFNIPFVKRDNSIKDLNFEFGKGCEFGEKCKIGSHSLVNEGKFATEVEIGDHCQLVKCKYGVLNERNELNNGDGITVGDHCVLTGERHSRTIFGDSISIGDHCVIKMETLFGSDCSFGDHNVFQKSVTSGEHCKFADHNKIVGNSKFDGGCEFGDYNKFGSLCSFGESCAFGAHSKMDRNCMISNYCTFEDRCCFGRACTFGDAITLGDRCQVLDNCVCFGQFEKIGDYFDGKFQYKEVDGGKKTEENGPRGNGFSIAPQLQNSDGSEMSLNNIISSNVDGNNNKFDSKYEGPKEKEKEKTRVEEKGRGKEKDSENEASKTQVGKEKEDSFDQDKTIVARLVHCGDRIELIAAPDGIGTLVAGIEHGQIEMTEDRSLKVGSNIVGFMNKSYKYELFKDSKECIRYFQGLTETGNDILAGSGNAIVLTKAGVGGDWPFDASRRRNANSNANEYSSFVNQYCAIENFDKIGVKVAANLQRSNSAQYVNDPAFELDRKCLPYFLKVIESLDKKREIDDSKLDGMLREYTILNIARLHNAGYGPVRSSVAHGSAKNDFRI